MNVQILAAVIAAAALSGCRTLPPNQAALPDGVPDTGREADSAGRGSTFYLTQDFSGARTHGSGRYRYRLVLLHPSQDNRVMPEQPYALSHNSIDLPFVTDKKDVFQGVTDRYGRTDVFAFEQPVDSKGWNLRQRTGKGPYGVQFVLRDQDDGLLQDFAYLLLICGKHPYEYRGITDKLGQTAYVATPSAQNISLYSYDGEPLNETDIQADCNGQTDSKKTTASQ